MKYPIIFGLCMLLLLGSVMAAEPELKDLRVEEISDSKVRVIFNVNSPVNYSIRYGTDAYMMYKVSDRSIIYNKKDVVIDKVFPDIKYYYNITLCDFHSVCRTFGPYSFKIQTGDSGLSDTVVMSIDGKSADDVDDENIMSINVRLNYKLHDAMIELEKLNRRPDGVDFLTRKVYRYYKINKINLPDYVINSAQIRFRVSKRWLMLSELPSDQITLYEYYGGWKPVDTVMMSQDGSYVYYSATVSSINLIAIGQIPKNGNVTQKRLVYSPGVVNITVDKNITNKTSDNASDEIMPTDQKNITVEKESPQVINQTIKPKDYTRLKRWFSISGIIVFLTLVIGGFYYNLKEELMHYKNMIVFYEKSEIKELIRQINRNIKNGQRDVAMDKYKRLEEIYSKLSRDDKNKHYPKIEKIIEKM